MTEAPERGDTDVVGARVVAQIVDLFVIFFAILAVMFFSGFSGGALGALTGGGEGVADAFVGVGFLAAFFVFLGYGFVLEALWDGQTLGKRLAGIRVVKEDGEAIGPGAALVRNLPAIVSLSWLAYLVALLSMAMSDRRQRLFDLLAGTVVVREGYGAEESVPTPDEGEMVFGEAGSDA